jgi:toxin YoeB
VFTEFALVSWVLVFTKQARKDAKKASAGGLRSKIEVLLQLIAEDPYASPPPFEKLVGDLAGAISRRINIQHRLVYQVLEDLRTVKVLRMWSHYD